jgi:hypothetical protein
MIAPNCHNIELKGSVECLQVLGYASHNIKIDTFTFNNGRLCEIIIGDPDQELNDQGYNYSTVENVTVLSDDLRTKGTNCPQLIIKEGDCIYV